MVKTVRSHYLQKLQGKETDTKNIIITATPLRFKKQNTFEEALCTSKKAILNLHVCRGNIKLLEGGHTYITSQERR